MTSGADRGRMMVDRGDGLSTHEGSKEPERRNLRQVAGPDARRIARPRLEETMLRIFAWFVRTPDPIDALIAEKGARVRFKDFDDELRERTQAKREEAEQLKREGRRLESSPVRRGLRRAM